MHDQPDLILTLAAALTAALAFGYITQRVGLSPIVGYLLAGVLIGPHTPGFIGDVHVAQQFAEIGIILLMFGVGLHFHLKDLLAVKGVRYPARSGKALSPPCSAWRSLPPSASPGKPVPSSGWRSPSRALSC